MDFDNRWRKAGQGASSRRGTCCRRPAVRVYKKCEWVGAWLFECLSASFVAARLRPE